MSSDRRGTRAAATHERSKAYRGAVWALLVVSLLALYLLGRPLLVSPRILDADDFVQYWAAGRVALNGGNPYAPEELLPVQHAAGRTSYVEGAPTIVWNPPWMLPALMVFGALPYPEARLAWFLLSLTLTVGCLLWAWRSFGGDRSKVWAALLIGLSFVPTLQALQAGQIGPMILAMTVGFAVLADRRKEFWAGAMLALLTVKPQLILPVGLVALLWFAHHRSLRAIAGALCSIAIASGLAAAVNPSVFGAYVRAVTSYPPVAWATPTLGGLLRVLIGVEKVWLQSVPPLVGAMWAAAYWWRRRQQWVWTEQLSLLLLVSLVTAPYAWPHDFVLLSLPVLQMASQMGPRPWGRQQVLIALSYLLIEVAALIVLYTLHDCFWFFWLPSALLIWAIVARKLAQSAPGTDE